MLKFHVVRLDTCNILGFFSVFLLFMFKNDMGNIEGIFAGFLDQNLIRKLEAKIWINMFNLRTVPVIVIKSPNMTDFLPLKRILMCFHRTTN